MLRTLFEPEEIGIIQQYARAVGQAAYKDPNPSGTASAVRAMMRNENDSWLKTFLQTQSKRELFSKHNVVMARIYQMLAKKVPANVFGSRDVVGGLAARKAVDQGLTLKPRPSPAGYAAGWAAGLSEQVVEQP